MGQSTEKSALRLKMIRVRATLVMGSLLVVYLGTFFKLYDLQILKGDILKKRALVQYRSQKKIRGIRGTIYDRNLRELALSVDMDSVYMNPLQVEGDLKKVAKLLDIPLGKLVKKAEMKKQFVWVKRKISPAQANALRNQAVKGIYTLPEGKRFYPRRELAGHLLGFAGLDNRGLEGVELAFEDYLARGSGLRGHNVRLTLDEAIQFIVEEALSDTCNKYRARSGQVVVMEPASGRILAMAVYPRFDPNLFRRAKAGRWRNRCFTDGFEPGSIMKVFVAAAALEEGLYDPGQRIFCKNGKVNLKGAVINDWKPYGWLEFREVIEKSSNVGAVEIGRKLGKRRLFEYFSRLGFGKKTGVKLPGEIPGIMRDLSQWSENSTAYHSIGQGILVTPIQFLRALCAVANGGILPEPRIVEEIWDPETGVSADFLTNPKTRRVFKESTCEELTSILQRVVESGTGKKGGIDAYTVAGKTGTAQKFNNAAGKYYEDRYVSSFVGFAPVSSPRIAVLVTVDEPKGAYYGGEVAAPVFARIARQVLEYMQVSHDKENLMASLPRKIKNGNRKIGSGRKFPKKAEVNSFVSLAGSQSINTRYTVMPGLRGKSMRQVMKMLSGSGLHVKIKGSGFAVSQSPPTGKKIPPDRVCTVQFGPPGH